MPPSAKTITVREIKRTSFGRAFTHRTYADSGINSCTACHIQAFAAHAYGHSATLIK